MGNSYKDYSNSCLLFRQSKEGNEKRADYTGEIEVESAGGYFVALWGRKDRNGNTYLALRPNKKSSNADRQRVGTESASLHAKEAKGPGTQARTPKPLTGPEQRARERAVGLNESGEPLDITF